MNKADEKYFKAIEIAQIYIGTHTAFREMLEHMVEDPSQATLRNLPQRMLKMLNEMDDRIEKTVSPYPWKR